ncbi:hypothetical protein [Alphaentomopoxvirus acuprea]|uniref:Uncharacterized protein n=1 Tax=Alphaentomopoxvirus acuprea TaxID=62099 RepID=W6JKZ1_9POXV|nr:hypothetical protein BA82_gp105 [Anomala cuprea entomopoxvirus]BAO49465.1 hypothetical protein [Anomala cuprea entomopoxvirus]
MYYLLMSLYFNNISGFNYKYIPSDYNNIIYDIVNNSLIEYESNIVIQLNNINHTHSLINNNTILYYEHNCDIIFIDNIIKLIPCLYVYTKDIVIILELNKFIYNIYTIKYINNNLTHCKLYNRQYLCNNYIFNPIIFTKLKETNIDFILLTLIIIIILLIIILLSIYFVIKIKYAHINNSKYYRLCNRKR